MNVCAFYHHTNVPDVIYTRKQNVDINIERDDFHDDDDDDERVNKTEKM